MVMRTKQRGYFDDFIFGDFYQMFVYDQSLPLYLLLAISIFFTFIKQKVVFDNFTIMKFVFIFVGTAITYAVQYQRKKVEHRKHFVRLNTLQIIFLLVNVLIFTYTLRQATIIGLTTVEFFQEVLTAYWEQMCFALLMPIVVIFILRFIKRIVQGKYVVESGFFAIPMYLIALLSSTALFAWLHWRVYGEVLTIGLLFGIGMVLMTLGYSISPSISISLHLLNNIIVLVKLIGG